MEADADTDADADADADSDTDTEPPPTVAQCNVIEFDGATTELALDGRLPAALEGLYELTVEAWVYNSGAGAPYRNVVRIADLGPRGILFRVGASLDSNSGPNKFEVQIGTTGGYATTVGEDVPLNRWSHLAAVFDGSNLTLFQDGIQTAQTVSGGTATTDGSTNARIGFVPSISQEYFNGRISQVQISSTARYSTTFTPSTSWQADEHTLGLWYLDEGADELISDLSGNDYRGTLANGTWVADCPQRDGDGDGHPKATDCDDDSPTIYPLAGDSIGDGIDQDCDGLDCEAAFAATGVYLAICSPPGLTSTAAHAQCITAGHDGLASIGGATEDAWLSDLLDAVGQTTQDNPVGQIGLTDEGTEGNWAWRDGSPLNYTNWNSASPGGGSSENCAELYSTGATGGWNDIPCEASHPNEYFI